MFATLKGRRGTSSRDGEGKDSAFVLVDSCPGKHGLSPILRLRKQKSDARRIRSIEFLFINLEEDLVVDYLPINLLS